MKTIRILVIPALFFAGLFLMSFVVPQDWTPQKWDIPEKYLSMQNPQAAGDAEMVKLGKMLWAKHCKSCHGGAGQGDGPKAAQLETFPGNFTVDAFHKQSDGVLYYKSIIGRDEMPNFESKIPDEEERWALITYMRATFK